MAETNAVTVVVATDVPTGVLETVKSAAQVMWAAVSTMMDDAEEEGKALGLPPDRRVGSDRLGGIVGGKALVAEDRSRAAVIVTGERSEVSTGSLS